MPQGSMSGARSSVAGGGWAYLARSVAARRALAVAGAAVLTALAARVAVPVPGSPVPFTLQPMAVLIAGVALGPQLGAASMAAYLAAGAAGLPVFVAGGGLAYLLGPTGGYLLAYPAAAGVVGWAAWRRSGVGWRALGLAAGVLLIHAGGVSWLAVLSGLEVAVAQGSTPFLLLDAFKAVLVLLFADRLADAARGLLG